VEQDIKTQQWDESDSVDLRRRVVIDGRDIDDSVKESGPPE